MEILLIVWLLSGIAAGLIWSSKGGSMGAGFLLGLLLGIIGLIIVLIATPSRGRTASSTRECPHCKEPLRRDASVCPHCQRDSEPWRLHKGRWWVQRDAGWYYLDERGRWVLLPQDAAETP